jgi:hypothetical protein
MLLRLFFTLVPCVLCLTTSALAATSVDDVVKMVKAGLGEDIIIAQLAKDNTKFDLSVDDLIKLKGAKVPEQVIKAMVSGPASSGASTTGSPATAAPSGAALEIGVLYLKKGEWTDVLPEVVNWKTGGVLKNIATVGIVKGDVNGNVNGAHSKNSVVSPLQFKIVAPEGVAITEYQLLRLHENKDYREFRTVTGGVMHVKGGAIRDLVPFESKKIGPRVFEILLPNTLGAGEYGFLPPGAFGSASSASIGKMYTFRVIE